MFKRIYFDYNAAMPMHENAYKCLIEHLQIYANPFSTHKEGLEAKTILENARRQIAEFFALPPHNIIFTSGASESAATLLTKTYYIGKTPHNISHLYIGATEHPCIMSGGQFTHKDISIIPVFPNGYINQELLEEKLKAHDREKGLALVAIQAANSETGILQDTASIAQIVHRYGGILIVDLVQILGKTKLDVKNMLGDFYIISSHKLGGPKNIGAIICSSTIMAPQALIKGAQENGRRGGTQAIALCSSFAGALKSSEKNDYEALKILRDYLEQQLYALDKNIIFYGKDSHRLPNTSFFRFPQIDAQTLQMALDLEGFAVSAGSACSSGKITGSHVLAAMGEEIGTTALRVSLGPPHKKADIDKFIQSLKIILERS